ncbi:MAG TPA: pyruvate carboxylase, partial [Chitinophagaceae bacterium]|nr:pyruvate carboxylase [Chitinophagaceae bacterium]
KVDAIHPGYGFLSENVLFAQRCKDAGLLFVGPEPEVMAQLGDKVAARAIALATGIPLIEGSWMPLDDPQAAEEEATRIGYPVMLKAAAGGGGRGMRVVRARSEFRKAFLEARSEAAKAFGDDRIFFEKFIESPKHIEVQLMGDNYGNIVHLFERDCSVQRRFQKVVEVAPSPNLPGEVREKLYEYALRIARKVNFNNVGTVEFLVDAQNKIYFIEVNPRIQVEHTITEEVTGIDIVRSQILITKGHRLSDPEIFIHDQQDVHLNGFAIQCRITTEDPENGFTPDYGTVIAYRNAGGFGIRLDEGSSYSGVKISPFFDSLLVKVTAWGRTLSGASQRLHRTLREFRIRGVNTNIRFLENVITHEIFRKGNCTVDFIEKHPELFRFKKPQDQGTRTLLYLAHIRINGHPDIPTPDPNRKFRLPRIPAYDRYGPFPPGTRTRLEKLGRKGFLTWLQNEKSVQITDTTFRDAHQSLLATRVRTRDILAVAEGYAKQNPRVFSMEMWGGATFDSAMRFLHESPWERLKRIREAMPHTLLQMLLRGSNAVGYSAYPQNLVEMFIEKAAETGIDVFRVFDSLNWPEALLPSIRFISRNTEALAEAAICYTGDIQDPSRTKYSLQYYLDLARKMEDGGAHLLAIKDMSGLLKPDAAFLLVSNLKKHLSIPIVLHTHDTAGVQAATYLKGIEAGVDVIDCAIASLSGLTSQPNLNSMVAILQNHERSTGMDLNTLNAYASYWEDIREYYYPFESDLKASTAEVYIHEMPGGQYSNLRLQAESLGLGDKLDLIKQNYAVVNRLFGDLVKVTPSSKVVGDMALFMTANGLSEEDVMDPTRNLSFPESVKGFFRGEIGIPYGGFPQRLKEIVLAGEAGNEPPPAQLPPVDFDQEFFLFQKRFPDTDFLDFLSYSMFPKVFESYRNHLREFGEVSAIPTPAFFYPMKNGQEILIPLSQGKTIIVKLLYALPPDDSGMCMVSFELNGYNRTVRVRDRAFKSSKPVHQKATRPGIHIGAPLQGKLSSILVTQGSLVQPGTPLFLIEAMKMETTVTASQPGRVKSIHLPAGTMVQQEDLVVELEAPA